MKNIRKLIGIICCFMVFIIHAPLTSYAYERDEHDQYMEEVLFRYYKEIKRNSSEEEVLKALGCACYLAIDQFNNNGQKDLDFLISFGVEDIPEKVSDISFDASGTTHRTHTHRGWDFEYFGITKNLWPIRKQIIYNTVDKIFDFRENKEQKESFCALLYYIHILGDHMDDSSYASMTRNGLKMDVGGRIDNEDIIHELGKHLEVLFEDQKGTHSYQSFLNSLWKYDRKLTELVRSEGGINTEEEFQKKQEYTQNVMELLTYYVPRMLKKENFFSEVFYNE